MTKKQVLDHFGSVLKAAEKLGMSHQAIYKWDKVPYLRQLQIEELTAGRLKAVKLNRSHLNGK